MLRFKMNPTSKHEKLPVLCTVPVNWSNVIIFVEKIVKFELYIRHGLCQRKAFVANECALPAQPVYDRTQISRFCRAVTLKWAEETSHYTQWMNEYCCISTYSFRLESCTLVDRADTLRSPYCKTIQVQGVVQVEQFYFDKNKRIDWAPVSYGVLHISFSRNSMADSRCYQSIRNWGELDPVQCRQDSVNGGPSISLEGKYPKWRTTSGTDKISNGLMLMVYGVIWQWVQSPLKLRWLSSERLHKSSCKQSPDLQIEKKSI